MNSESQELAHIQSSKNKKELNQSIVINLFFLSEISSAWISSVLWNGEKLFEQFLMIRKWKEGTNQNICQCENSMCNLERAIRLFGIFFPLDKINWKTCYFVKIVKSYINLFSSFLTHHAYKCIKCIKR